MSVYGYHDISDKMPLYSYLFKQPSVCIQNNIESIPSEELTYD